MEEAFAESPFCHLLDLLRAIEDPRRAEGKLYKLPEVMLFSILAMMAGANSYRGIHSFVEVHLEPLKAGFGLSWRRAPAYTTIRNVLQGLDGAAVERVFRLHGEILRENAGVEGMRVVAFDGKGMKELAAWTNSHEVLRSALEEARNRDALPHVDDVLNLTPLCTPCVFHVESTCY